MSSDTASEAFDALRAEVALLRRAIEGVSTSRKGERDYSPTLAKLMKLANEADEQLKAISGSPSLAITPDRLIAQIHLITVKAREQAQAEMNQAQSAFTRASADLARATGVLRGRDQQNRWLAYAAAASAVTAVILWVLVSGPIARRLPASWQVGERMAAATLDLDRWAAGSRLMASADPASWNAVLASHRLVTTNQAGLAKCASRANRSGRSISCEIQVEPTAASRGDAATSATSLGNRGRTP